MIHDIPKFIKDQLSVWPLAAANFRALKKCETKHVKVGGLNCLVQFNPERVASSTANTDPEVIAARKCFLCDCNRPPEQFHLKFEGRKGRGYNIQVNPYPIFPAHLVIVRDKHLPQAIWHHFPDMLDFAQQYRDYTVFYNGPGSGASAPDHLHFQAVPRHLMPLEEAVDAFLDAPGEPLGKVKDATLYRFNGFCNGVYALKALTSKSLAKLFYQLLDCVECEDNPEEPKFNLFAYVKDSEYRTFVVMRDKVRSHHYYAEGPDHLTISPGAADMAGVFVAPFREDFDKVTEAQLEEMLSEVAVSDEQQRMIEWRLTRTQPKIDVGLLTADEITFEIVSDGAGPQKVRWCDGRIAYNGMLYDELFFDSRTRSTLFAEPSFILHDVVIGIDFHWQQKRTLKFAGGLKFIVEGDKIVAINHIGLENYLLSVISSEMKSTCPLESLKAHAVISRSWLLARVQDYARWSKGASVEVPHTNFHVCADDHCQRYQGLTMAAGNNVRRAIDETWGQVLKSGGRICDARFSKCCGGLTEKFSACWQDNDYPYLRVLPDTPGEQAGGNAFCDTSDDRILSQVLNDYDLESKDFFRWEVRYSRDCLSELVSRRSGIVFGEIRDLIPLERGGSGRIIRLKIVGSARTMVVGKELMIRRILSESHLKSSAFDVEWEGDEVILRGRGWGHGVGLCQIGAAVMSFEGYDYRQILEHYYPGTTIERK